MEQEIRLNRSGQRPLAFMGVEVASATTKHKQSTRWWTVRVFRTNGGFVSGIGHLTCWEGERDEYWVDKAKNPTGVLASVERRIPALVRDVADQLRGARHTGEEEAAQWHVIKLASLTNQETRKGTNNNKNSK